MHTITKQRLKEKLANNTPVALIDVREPAEHLQFNIGGLLLPLGKIQVLELESINYLKNAEVVCYCRSGMRSANACMILEQNGFKNVSNLVGGMVEWQN